MEKTVSIASKNILLVFIHGFKGGQDTFGTFPADLETDLNQARKHLDVEYKSIVYPAYDTKGNFKFAVSSLREWLQNTVIDIESARETFSPTVHASVKVILLGHSMGGLVAADVVLDIHQEYSPAPLFPNIIGIFALDSPMLGLAPSLWTNGADGLLQKGKNLYENAASLGIVGSGLWASKSMQQKDQKAIEDGKRNTGFGWKSIAAISAATAFAAGGALYSQKDNIGRGFSWITDHLEFIGVLRQNEELSQRTVKVNSIEGVQFSCYYTLLSSKSALDCGPRTFIVLPKGDLLKSRFHEQQNSHAVDEVASHTSMFIKDKNSGYEDMKQGIAGEIRSWVDVAMATSRQVITDQTFELTNET